MAFKKVILDKIPSSNEVISISKSGIYFSAEFIKNNNLKEAAKNLYKILRLIKNKNYKNIAVEKIPNIGFGEAINDRLKRASIK